MLTLVPKFDCMTLRPICLSTPDLDETKDELVVAGWGRTQTEERSSLLQVKKITFLAPIRNHFHFLISALLCSSFCQVLNLEEVSARQCRAEYQPLGVQILDRFRDLF